ncbi:hypothetical protein BCA37_06460 [Mycobacterium sp. djl-10]|nr:hypothetical protein BCA37_06460 [Mycobacterium sp. djl-10]
MTGPQDSETSTRPISVAELLAKNGTIGAAPPGGRRRRRRGNADAVTVAELTGEIPIVRTGEIPVVREEPEAEADAEPDVPETEVIETEPPAAEEDSESHESNGNGSAAATVAETPHTRPELADVPVARRGPAVKPERSHFPLPTRRGPAETMSPDPVVDEAAAPEVDEQPDELGIGSGPAEASSLQTYLKATSGPLFGGQTVADDLARQSRTDEDAEPAVAADELEVLEVEEALQEPSDTGTTAEGSTEKLSRGQMAVHALLIAVQSIVAVAFGAGLFIAFDQLWKWNSIVALVLGVLVILGLVVGVRVVRKTEDIGSTLTAVAVGALVTFGPLALLQAS